MARSKSPRKKHNPKKAAIRMMHNHASQCIAYQWETDHPDSDTTFNCYGPFDEDRNIKLIEWALSRAETWLLTAIACFVDPNGEYYEEMVTTAPVGPINMMKNWETLMEYKSLTTRNAVESGNPLHFVTSVFSMSLQSSELDQKMENETWLKRQSALRADHILDNVDALRAIRGK